MAERWQQWMPFHIDRWRGSPSVQAMHPAAQMGYLNMLCSCWQSHDCCLPDDAVDLATESRLGDELWALYGPRILRKFSLVDGRWRNEVLFSEWDMARTVYEKRKSGAVRTNTSRSANADRTHSQRNTDTQTETGTVTLKKPSRKIRGEESPDARFAPFKECFLQAYTSAHEITPPWDGREGKALSDYLRATPKITLEHWNRILVNRFRSADASGVPLSRWIRECQKFYQAPLNGYNKPEVPIVEQVKRPQVVPNYLREKEVQQ